LYDFPTGNDITLVDNTNIVTMVNSNTEVPLSSAFEIELIPLLGGQSYYIVKLLT